MNKKISISVSFLLVLVVAFAGYFLGNHKPKSKEDLPKGSMRVHFIDVGQGDCTLFQFPDGKVMLIDAGEAEKGESVAEYMNDLGIKKVDFLVGTHPHSDHIGGLQKVIENFETENIYMPKVVHDSVTFENLINCIKDKGLKVKAPKAGDKIYDKDGIEVEVLSPGRESYGNLNDYSIVLKVKYNDRTFLLAGDAERGVLDEIEINGKVDVLKVPHHGSDTSVNEELYEKIRPDYAVISVGEKNSYGHPHDEALDIIEKYKAVCFRTDEDGTIVFETDGENIKVVNGE